MPEMVLPPPFGLLALELRAGFELAAFFSSLPLLEKLPGGDGHPVLVLPGFLANDFSTKALRWFLRRRGYHVHGWRLGRNVGPSPELIDRLALRFHALRQTHGRRVTLIGWSLGGIYARELARAFPEDVRQLITLASPFRHPEATNLTPLFRRTDAGRMPEYRGAEIHQRLRQPVPVPTTSIFSKTDGICAWQSCVDLEDETHQNVEVSSSHVGMGHNPAALYVIADRLAQPEGVWRPFTPHRWSRFGVRLLETAAG